MLTTKMSVSMIKSERGKDLLIFENFTFSKDRVLKSGETSWRCCQKRLQCKAKIYTVGTDNLITKKNDDHNHEADERKVTRKVISNTCKRKAEEDISERPSKIICKTLASHLPPSITTTDITYIRRNMYNCRRKMLPGPLPKSKEEVHGALSAYSEMLLTNKNENFLFINDVENSIVVFTCETNINILTEMDQLYMDGTFSFCPKYFCQFFTIHGLQNGHYIPLVFCLLPSKTTESYKTCFSLLKFNIYEKYCRLFNPRKIFVDFEKAIHVAILNIWPHVEINGCRFHLHQAWLRKIQSVGLKSEYESNSEIGKWLKNTFGLTYLNPDEVDDCFVFDLMSYKPHSDLLDKYCDYLLDTYINDNAVFPPSLWAEESASVTRTTNCCESFHAKFNASFYSTHPSVYVFIEKLKECQIDTYIKIQSLHVTARIKDKKVKAKLESLGFLVNRYKLGEISRLHYVKCVSYL